MVQLLIFLFNTEYLGDIIKLSLDEGEKIMQLLTFFLYI